MGIHADWMKVFKEECQEAFTERCPLRPVAGFIDGQIQLMKPNGVISWDQFVQYQFVNPLRRMLRERGAQTVVLAFDDYAHVPMAKGMTQAKRAKKVEVAAFHEREQLPELIPDCWDRAIMNRTFKGRVIQLVIRRLPALLDLAPGEHLVIDYKGTPQRYSAGEPHPSPIPELEPLGEADLKFFRYAEMFGSLLVMATDSDYLPISLLRMQTRFRGQEPPRVVLQRLRVSLPADKPKLPKGAPRPPTKRQTEFVNVNMLLDVLCDAFRQTLPSGVVRHSHEGHFIEMLCALIALFGGTDFTRPMPNVGPRRVWDSLVALMPALVRSFDVERMQLREAVAGDEVVARMYARVFAAHVAAVARGGTGAVLAGLKKSKLADSTKARLPSEAFVQTTVRNANWVLLYWAGCGVDELSGDFGYRPQGRGVTYADQ